MSTSKKFPQTVYVYEVEDADETFLGCAKDIDEIPDDVRAVTQYYIGDAFKVSRNTVLIKQPKRSKS